MFDNSKTPAIPDRYNRKTLSKPLHWELSAGGALVKMENGLFWDVTWNSPCFLWIICSSYWSSLPFWLWKTLASSVSNLRLSKAMKGGICIKVVVQSGTSNHPQFSAIRISVEEVQPSPYSNHFWLLRPEINPDLKIQGWFENSTTRQKKIRFPNFSPCFCSTLATCEAATGAIWAFVS